MNSQKYNMSFTAGALLQTESVTIAKLYLEVGDWDLVKDKVIAENLLQSRALSTLKRLSHEIIARLSTLNIEELTLLTESEYQDQAYMLWIAICRYYQFIADFATEVLRERFITFKPDLQHSDFDTFLNRKCDWHSELDSLSVSTRKKLRQVLFKMLRDANFLDSKNNIQATMLSSRLIETIKRNGSRDIKYFTISENAI
ncbi:MULTISPECIES: DUF1819 family protein [unclassified Psychrobacter]|uniref:DUF1819 family protein n=1 Tax=unclassified Psychrobacter TaxID=196806 RepID=UPI000ED9A491|nr:MULTISPECIES: DUF1819 family protein [unclassified Psychrobacter]MBE8608573.1 DUF1819 family protein [Pseudomonas lundensis]HCI75255.1 DUF1819 domain-containing protein [Psychrobacter sp.]